MADISPNMSPSKPAGKRIVVEEKAYTNDPDGVHIITRKRTTAEAEVIKRKEAGKKTIYLSFYPM
jgi:hypothetical protein